MRISPKFVTTASAFALAAITVCAVALLPTGASAADPPACPSNWPDEPQQGAVPDEQYGQISHDGFHTDSNDDEWYVIRGTDSKGNTHAHAYRADTRYRTGYQPASPDETCYVKLRRPGNTADLAQPEQVIFPKEREETTSARTTSNAPPQTTEQITIRQILATMSPADQTSAILCLLQLAGNADPDEFLDNPDNVQPAIDAGCLPAQ